MANYTYKYMYMYKYIWFLTLQQRKLKPQKCVSFWPILYIRQRNVQQHVCTSYNAQRIDG